MKKKNNKFRIIFILITVLLWAVILVSYNLIYKGLGPNQSMVFPFDWIYTTNMIWFPAVASVILAILGKFYASGVFTLGCFTAAFAGSAYTNSYLDWMGNNYSHGGWAVWLIFIFFILPGIAVGAELLAGRRGSKKLKTSRLILLTVAAVLVLSLAAFGLGKIIYSDAALGVSERHEKDDTGEMLYTYYKLSNGGWFCNGYDYEKRIFVNSETKQAVVLTNEESFSEGGTYSFEEFYTTDYVNPLRSAIVELR